MKTIALPISDPLKKISFPNTTTKPETKEGKKTLTNQSVLGFSIREYPVNSIAPSTLAAHHIDPCKPIEKKTPSIKIHYVKQPLIPK